MRVPLRFQSVTTGALRTLVLGSPIRMVTIGMGLFLVVALLLFKLGIPDVWSIGIAISLLTVCFTAVIYHRNENHYRQIEAMVQLSRALPTDSPLPPLRAWRLGPDAGVILSQWLRRMQPTTVVEIGCGASTCLIASILKDQGKAFVYALEHDATQVEKCQKQLQLLGLGQHAKVIHAPLVEHSINGQEWSWYDLRDLPGDLAIDLLLIDGPPIWTQKMARYPAMPLLIERLNDNATVLLDDANRFSERKVRALWENLFPEWNWELHPTEDGFLVGTKSQSSKDS